MPLHEAMKRCPDLIVVAGDYRWYEELSGRFFDYRAALPLTWNRPSIVKAIWM